MPDQTTPQRADRAVVSVAFEYDPATGRWRQAAEDAARHWRERYRIEANVLWDDSLPPGGEVCADCGQPVESEPCPEHHPRTVVARLRQENTAAHESARILQQQIDDQAKDTYRLRERVTELERERDAGWPTPLAWADDLDDGDQADFLADLAGAVMNRFAPGFVAAEVLAAVRKVCATYRLIAVADREQANAPGPEGDGQGEQQEPRCGRARATGQPCPDHPPQESEPIILRLAAPDIEIGSDGCGHLALATSDGRPAIVCLSPDQYRALSAGHVDDGAETVTEWGVRHPRDPEFVAPKSVREHAEAELRRAHRYGATAAALVTRTATYGPWRPAAPAEGGGTDG